MPALSFHSFLDYGKNNRVILLQRTQATIGKSVLALFEISGFLVNHVDVCTLHHPSGSRSNLFWAYSVPGRLLFVIVSVVILDCSTVKKAGLLQIFPNPRKHFFGNVIVDFAVEVLKGLHAAWWQKPEIEYRST